MISHSMGYSLRRLAGSFLLYLRSLRMESLSWLVENLQKSSQRMRPSAKISTFSL